MKELSWISIVKNQFNFNFNNNFTGSSNFKEFFKSLKF